MPEKPGNSPQNPVTVDQLLREANVPVVSSAPAPAPDKPAAPIPQGAIFTDKSGKRMYRYVIDGNIVLLPKPVEQMSEQDYYNLPITLYDNMPGRLPQNLQVIFKDPQWAGYWFSKIKDQRRIAEGRSLGFLPAKAEDLEKYYLELNDQDGAVEQGDLVLMKTHKINLFMRYKAALDKAKVAGGTEGYKNKANEALNPANRSKDPYYVAEQAKQEFSGVGPLVPVDEAGVLNTSR